MVDETWVNAGHTKSSIWVDASIKTARQAFQEGLSTGLKNPTGKGKRLIVCNIGSEFVPDALWSFESKKSGDYHEEMDGPNFEEWFENILPKLEDGCVIVLDNASYHSRRTEKLPTSASRKVNIQEWLRSKNIAFGDDLIKAELLRIAKTHKPAYNKYVVDEMARNQNKIVLRLPPYHCEINPIELVWAEMKNYVASKNTSFKFRDMKKLFAESIERIDAVKWQNCIKHVVENVAIRSHNRRTTGSYYCQSRE
ncbi:hypothetical protein HHI36_016519 [Cryptolaemus montrouzieri]|uniref:Tc1-like transposase DDE domain-containing protein n=1 Tax=Cryptolaemus montrouzieri TaxID=559131 RepID=A0ABD2NK13_9CUCU